MGLDRVDWVAVLGLIFLTPVLVWMDVEPPVVAAGLSGFLLAIALYRLYEGRIWEGFGWLAWVGAAVVLALGVRGHPLLTITLIIALLVGVGLQFGSRYDRLPDVWRVDESSR